MWKYLRLKTKNSSLTFSQSLKFSICPLNFFLYHHNKLREALSLMTTKQPLTWFLCPILCARAWACKSFWGFQSESKMMTVSAVAKLIPRPPARVDNRKQKSFKEITRTNCQFNSKRSKITMWSIVICTPFNFSWFCTLIFEILLFLLLNSSCISN